MLHFGGKMKQSEQSKRWMSEALYSLLENKHFSEITVKDITEKAGVSRLTFYRNFETKEDIIRYHMKCGFEEYLQELENNKIISLQDMITLCFRYWEQRKEEIIMLSSQNMSWLLREPFEEFLNKILECIEFKEKYTYFQVQFLIGGMFSNMIAWVNDRHDRQPEDIAKEIVAIIKTERS